MQDIDRSPATVDALFSRERPVYGTDNNRETVLSSDNVNLSRNEQKR